MEEEVTNTKKENKIKEVLWQHKKIVMIVGIALMILVLGIVMINNTRLKEPEEKSIIAVKALRTALKNPESLQVHEIRYEDKTKDGKTSVSVYIDYSAQNGFGGLNRNVALIIDGEYFCSDSKADTSITKYTSLADSLEITMAKAIKSTWNEKEKLLLINKTKVMKQLDK